MYLSSTSLKRNQRSPTRTGIVLERIKHKTSMAILQYSNAIDILLHPIFLVSLFLLSFILLFIHNRSNGKLISPPSPPKLPIIGNLHQLGKNPHRSIKQLADKYGSLMLIRLGRSPTLVVSSAKLVKEMFKNYDVIISNRPMTMASEILFYHCESIGFAPYGEYWKQARKIVKHELLSFSRVKDFQVVREEEVAALNKRISKACSDGVPINLSEVLLVTSNNIASRCVLGKSFVGEDGRSKPAELAKKVMGKITSSFGVGDFFPSLRWIDVLTGFVARMKGILRELDSFFDGVIEEHGRMKSDTIDESNSKDFVDILLQLQKDGIGNFKLTQSNIKAILLDMFTGGTDTTAAILEWLMAELMRNPRVMKKAQEEIRRVVGKKSKIDMNDINQMSYLKCVIKETLRLYPPAPLLVHRETSADINLGGYNFPRKTKIFIHAWAIQRDPSLWDKPEEFWPERFEKNEIDFKGQDFQLIPFGCGRRVCPGLTFGLTNIEHISANILYWFDWKLPCDNTVLSKELDMSERYGFALRKEAPVLLLPTLYTP